MLRGARGKNVFLRCKSGEGAAQAWRACIIGGATHNGALRHAGAKKSCFALRGCRKDLVIYSDLSVICSAIKEKMALLTMAQAMNKEEKWLRIRP